MAATGAVAATTDGSATACRRRAAFATYVQPRRTWRLKSRAATVRTNIDFGILRSIGNPLGPGREPSTRVIEKGAGRRTGPAQRSSGVSSGSGRRRSARPLS
jgi:hypothetical protein